MTAYFVPDSATLQQLLQAIRRGVTVEILVPGEFTDSRLSQLAGFDAIEQLLNAGARIWQYDKTLLHAKLMLVDGQVCAFGSPNLNHRSMGKDEECCAIALSPKLCDELEQRFADDCLHSTELNYRAWQQRGLLSRFKERAARLITEQL